MMLACGPLPPVNGHDVVSPGLPDKRAREPESSPADLFDFQETAKPTRSGLSSEEAHGSPHKDEEDPARDVEDRLSEAQPTAGAPPRRAGYTPLTLPIRPPSVIPMLRPEFFQSNFWHQFHAQRPLLESNIFLSRLDISNFTHMPIVLYAYSCLLPAKNVDKIMIGIFVKFLMEESLDGTADSLGVPGRLAAMCLVAWAASFGRNEEGKSDQSSDPNGRRSRTNNMVKELLYLIDSYGIIRKPTWDGLVALLAVLPLTKDIMSDFERATLHKLTMNAAESLVHNFKDTVSPELRLKDGLLPLRTLWWCVIQDWMVWCPSGGRTVLTTDDQHELASLLFPPSPFVGVPPIDKDSGWAFKTLDEYFGIPLKLASVYRLVQGILSNPQFRTRGIVDETQLERVWSDLNGVWNSLMMSTPADFRLSQPEFSNYSRIWKLFTFECYNHLDISLNQAIAVQLDWSAPLSQACHTARSKCRTLLKPIMEEVRALSHTSLGRYDACGLSKPIYSVAALIALSPTLGTKDDFLVCLEVLQQTKWVYSDHEKKVTDLRFLWSMSRDEPPVEPPKPLESQFLLDRFYATGSYSSPPSTGKRPSAPPRRRRASSPRPPPISPVPRPWSRAKSAKSRASSGESCCIPEGHNSPDDDVPSRKSPSRLAAKLLSSEQLALLFSNAR